MDPLFWTRFVRIEPFSKGDGHAEGVRRRVPPAGGGPGGRRSGIPRGSRGAGAAKPKGLEADRRPSGARAS